MNTIPLRSSPPRKPRSSTSSETTTDPLFTLASVSYHSTRSPSSIFPNKSGGKTATRRGAFSARVPTGNGGRGRRVCIIRHNDNLRPGAAAGARSGVPGVPIARYGRRQHSAPGDAFPRRGACRSGVAGAAFRSGAFGFITLIYTILHYGAGDRGRARIYKVYEAGGIASAPPGVTCSTGRGGGDIGRGRPG